MDIHALDNYKAFFWFSFKRTTLFALYLINKSDRIDQMISRRNI